ncbi:MAG: class I SAM-dependent methyltransferase [Thermodesulfobacteriota bacterium]
MGYVFDSQEAEGLEAWYRGEAGRQTSRRQIALLLRLLDPRPGERLLDVGCGPGWHLQAFKRIGLNVAGLDPSPAMLEMARSRLGQAAEIHSGRAEDLPFEDGEFDIVVFITCLEFVEDPLAALAEAARVARSRVLVGALNRFSLTALGRRLAGLFSESVYNQARFFSLWELSGLLRQTCGPGRQSWGSVGLLPSGLAGGLETFESRPQAQRTPFGAFIGLVSEIKPLWRTDRLTIKRRFKINPKPEPTALSRRTLSLPGDRPDAGAAAGQEARS